jgi:hypothetical protein
MPAKYVRPYSKGQKNDFNDAEAITEAVQRPTMKFVATKTVHGGPEQMFQSEAGYIDARPQTDSSTKTSCKARPEAVAPQRAGEHGARIKPVGRLLHRRSSSPRRRVLPCVILLFY